MYTVNHRKLAFTPSLLSKILNKTFFFFFFFYETSFSDIFRFSYLLWIRLRTEMELLQQLAACIMSAPCCKSDGAAYLLRNEPSKPWRKQFQSIFNFFFLIYYNLIKMFLKQCYLNYHKSSEDLVRFLPVYV